MTSAGQLGRPESNLTCGGHTSVTQELIPVKPSANWGLTRGGAHSQWPRGLVRASLVLIRRATAAVAGVSPAATRNAAEVHRGCATGGGWTREGHQKVARARAHLGGPTGGAGVAGVRRNGARGGGRSSGGCGVSAAACKRASCHASVTPRVVASATDARAGPFGHRGFAGDEPARRRLR